MGKELQCLKWREVSRWDVCMAVKSRIPFALLLKCSVEAMNVESHCIACAPRFSEVRLRVGR